MKEPDRSADADQMQHLRELVVGPTSTSLQQLREELADRQVNAEEVSRLLPEAIKRSTAEGPGLAKAIGPTFSAAFEESVKRDPQALADAVSPIMGPAIQRYIQQQIQAMVQSLNTALDHSLSPKGLRWRLEAWKTGRPFAEVVLLHTLIYRIEQVMLIDPETGMLMQSAASSAGSDDADLVSSLLSAIQDFMRDSFRHRTDAGSALQEIQTNELTVWMQHGSSATIAVAIRGEPPLSLRQKIQALLDRIHVEYRGLLDNFRGDTSPLELIRPDLEELLESEFVSKKGNKPEGDDLSSSLDEFPTEDLATWWKKQVRWILPTAIVFLLVGVAWIRHHSQLQQRLANQLDLPPTAELGVEDNILRVFGSARQEWIDQAKDRLKLLRDPYQLDVSGLIVSDQKWMDFLRELEAEPGITVIRKQRIGDEYELHGWRDPDSIDPEQVLQRVGLSTTGIRQHWDLLRSSDPRVLLKRLRESIEFPPHVSAYCEQNVDTVLIQGIAPMEWIEELHRVFDSLQIDERRFNLELLFPAQADAIE